MGASPLFGRTSSTSDYRDPEVIVGLDLGTSKIAVVVAEREDDGSEASIIGAGQSPASGMRKGLITHLEQASDAVKRAMEDAQKNVGIPLDEVTVAFSGGDVQSVRTSAMISLGRTPRSVQRGDISRVIDAAQADVAIPESYVILHTIPVQYTLDSTEGVEDPLGMTGSRLEIELESVYLPKATVQNVYNCVKKAGYNVKGFVIKPLASALGSLTREEIIEGAACVDIGGGTTGVALFADGRMKHLAVIPIGGDHVNMDVAEVLKVPPSKAEDIKKDVDLASAEALEHTEQLEFEDGGKIYSYSLSELTEIVQIRIAEIFEDLVRPHVQLKTPLKLIVTGGVSRCIGIEQFVQKIMGMTVRAALPIDHNSMHPGRNGPEYACASGIIRYVLEQERDENRYIDLDIDALEHGRSIGASGGGVRKPELDDRELRDSRGLLGRLIDTFKDMV